MLLRNKLSLMIFSFNVYFKIAASIDSHSENIKSQYLKNMNPIFMQFAPKCSNFKILLNKIHLYFCVPFPLIFMIQTLLNIDDYIRYQRFSLRQLNTSIESGFVSRTFVPLYKCCHKKIVVDQTWK